jgi:hypothetical protein
MKAPTIQWDGSCIGPGPIALDVHQKSGGNKGEVMWLLAGSTTSAAVICFQAERFGEFLQQHAEGLFGCEDVGALHWQLYDYLTTRGATSALNAIWRLANDARWIDLCLLDRQIRYAIGDLDASRRPFEALARKLDQRQHLAMTESVPSTVGQATAAAHLGAGEQQIRTLLRVFNHLWIRATELDGEAQPKPLPQFVWPRSEEERAEAQARTASFIQNCAQRQKEMEARMRQTVGPEAEDVVTRREASSSLSSCRAGPLRILGHGIECFAAIALKPDRRSGFKVDPSKLPAFGACVECRYITASREIFGNQVARRCFEWSNDAVRRDDKGFPVTVKEKLLHWLGEKDNRLFDVQHEPAAIPRPKGHPSLNPEMWGVWAGCDPHLSAWREVCRMAEMGRIIGATGDIHPRYATLPSLRSEEPNLAVYRSLGVPIFVPTDGYAFVVGRLIDLRMRCLAAVCLKRGYSSIGIARLYNYLLCEPNPLVVAAAELRLKASLQLSSELYLSNLKKHGYDPEAVDQETVEKFLELKPRTAGHWLRLTEALISIAPLGLPEALAKWLLKNDYGLDLTERQVQRLQAAIAESVAFEISAVREDATFEILTRNLDLTANEAQRKFGSFGDPESIGPNILRDIKRKPTRSPVTGQIKRSSQTQAGFRSSSPLRKKDFVETRGASLGGRVTTKTTSVAARRQEFLVSVDDVMLSVAHALVASGYRLVGIAGDEFVVEIPETQAIDDERERIRMISTQASRRLLGGPAATVCIELVERL